MTFSDAFCNALPGRDLHGGFVVRWIIRGGDWGLGAVWLERHMRSSGATSELWELDGVWTTCRAYGIGWV
jgi:hypothetical protein